VSEGEREEKICEGGVGPSLMSGHKNLEHFFCFTNSKEGKCIIHKEK
jgi:hypothetical protein